MSQLLGKTVLVEETEETTLIEVDLDYLETLTKDNPALRQALLQTMESETPEELNRLKAAADQEKWDDVRGYAHRLKSTLQLIGSQNLHARLEAVERDARDRRDTPSLTAKIQQLSLEIEAALIQVRKISMS